MTFCAAPFVHIVQNPNGEYRTCCMYEAPMKGRYRNIQEAFDSEENAIIRARMKSGKPLPECIKCDIDEQHNGKLEYSSYRQWFSKYEPNSKLQSVEFSVSNKCNFKCITCNEDYSNQFGPTIENPLPESLENVTFLKLLGGEPFLDKRNIDLLKIAPKGIEVMIVSNCSIFPKDEVLDLLSQFKTKIVLSIDGIGEIAEFVRQGTKWTKVERNFHKWMQTGFTTTPHYVVHALNAPYVDQTIQWSGLDERNWSWDFLTGPKHLNMSYLPDSIKEYILSKNVTLLEPMTEFIYSNEHNAKHFMKLCKLAFNAPDIMDDYIERFYEG